MAQRRMFSKKITDTDHFLEMPLSTQALYFHLNMGADDEGFIDDFIVQDMEPVSYCQMSFCSDDIC